MFVTSKLANTRMGPDDVEPNLRQTNFEFDIDAVDLFLIHHPYFMSYQRRDFIQTLDYLDTWKAMIKAYKKGKLKLNRSKACRKAILIVVNCRSLSRSGPSYWCCEFQRLHVATNH